MPQELQVLQCYSCKTYQVHIVKKEAKWSCKMCGDKQSVKKVFHRGNGKECRIYVQELNERRIKSESEILTNNKPEISTLALIDREYVDKSESKWFEFMEKSKDVENEDCGGPPSGRKRKLNDEESRPGEKNALKWTPSISTVVYKGKTVENNLGEKNSIFIGEKVINSNEQTEDNAKEVDHKKEVAKLTNESGETAEGSKWDEFDQSRNYFDISINGLSNLSNEKARKDQLLEHHKISINKLNQSSIFESEIGDVDSFLEM